MTEQEEMIEYKDDDFVYIDVANKKVVGLVEWTKDGNAQKKILEQPESDIKTFKRKTKRYLPWCSYLTAKKVYFIEGKYHSKDEYEPFEVVVDKALKEPYWKKDIPRDQEKQESA